MNDTRENIELRKEFIDELVENAKSADIYLWLMYRFASEALVSDPVCGQLETWESWVAAMQYHNAMFAVTTAPPGEEVECLIDHKSRKLVATGPRYCTNAENWQTAFYMAVVCRDVERIRFLAGIPVEFLREAGESDGAQYLEYAYEWVGALQALVHDDPDLLVERLGRAMELSDPRRVGMESAERGLNLLVFPEMDVLRCFLGGDPEAFEAALVRGLRSFGEFHTQEWEGKDRLASLLPLGLLALACLGFDRARQDPSFRMDVRSDYLPEHLLDAAWYGEFPI